MSSIFSRNWPQNTLLFELKDGYYTTPEVIRFVQGIKFCNDNVIMTKHEILRRCAIDDESDYRSFRIGN